MPIKIETIESDEDRATFIVNSDIWIKYSGNLEAQVDYDKDKYSETDIKQVINEVFITIIDFAIKTKANLKETDEIQP